MCSFRIHGGNKLNECSPVHSAVFNETWVISVGQQCEWEGWQPMTCKKKTIMRMKSWGSKLGRQSGSGARMWFCIVTENSQLQLLCLSNDNVERNAGTLFQPPCPKITLGSQDDWIVLLLPWTSLPSFADLFLFLSRMKKCIAYC